MPIDHVVRQGEYLSQIAEVYGFHSFKTIWDDPTNADLKTLRQSPNVLNPGDVLKIPDNQPRTELCATTKVHVFQTDTTPLLLRLALRDFDNHPLAQTSCEFEVEGKLLSLDTDANGLVEIPITSSATDGTLTFRDPLIPLDVSIPVQIGYLDPVTEVSGQKARLNNLGYITRSMDQVDDTYFGYVVQEFQCDQDLPVNGQMDDATQAKLQEQHGS